MASDESMKTLKSCMEFDEDDDNGDHPHLSRLSMCSSNSIYGGNQLSDDHEFEEEDGGGGGGMNMYMSLLSIESFDGDLDEEEEEEAANKKRLNSKLLLAAAGLSTGEDDSDRECCSLPATPPRLRRSKRHPNPLVEKEYASENEAHKAMSSTDDSRRSKRRNRRRRMMRNRSSWLSPSPFHQGANKCSRLDHDDDHGDNKENMNLCDGHCHSFSGESEGTGKVVVTRPKGGNRSLCMDMEEVKACRDLGFELEHKNRMQPSRLSLSASTLEASYATSSGSNSPIANWRISSPGDHPQEVKARLKVWAQAVALVSTSRQGT